ncbi:MAG: methionine--tRNA ligase subunit beta, partial [Clostridia bacterium]|nr:methionine--tRNA ligase subunit beta [Clostridia bacterium]
VLGKSDEGKPRLQTVMYVLAECIRAIAVYIQPTMPSTPARIYAQLGVSVPELMTWESVQTFGGLKPGTVVKKGEALFPRVDIKKELEAMAAEKDKAQKAEVKAQKKDEKAAKKEEKREEKKADDGIASFDDFMKIKLVAAKVIACEKVEKSDKLLKETLDVGGGQTKTVCSGIAKFYSPEEMVGKTVVLVTNFAPRKMAGQVSEGMLLCAEDPDGRVRLLTVDGDVAPGSEIG